MNASEIASTIAHLASEDGLEREKARKQLVVQKNFQVIAALISELVDPRQRVRWEAAKALSDIGDTIAALPLVYAMDDSDSDVAWIAAEGVADMGEAGLLAVLSGLTRSSRSGEFHKVAHHALKKFEKRKQFLDSISPVLEALEGSEPKLSAPVVAYQSLQRLRMGSTANFLSP